MDKRIAAVEQLVAEARAHRRSQMRALIALAIAIAVGLGGLAYALKEVARSQPARTAIDVSNLPPIQPGPGR
jgi:hypothetical protein